MIRRYAAVVMFSFLVMLPLPSTAQGEEMTITLREQLNVDWQNELLIYPFAASQGKCLHETLVLIGAQGRIPAQLLDVEYWPGGMYVKNARVAFVSDLASLETRDFLVRFDKETRFGNGPTDRAQ